MLRGAILGFGQVAEKAHLPAFQETSGFEIVAVADERPERIRAARELLPSAKTYSGLKELLGSKTDFDFVDIATPPGLHADQVLDCLAAQRHVLCEKPLALRLEDFERIRLQSILHGRAVFTVHNWKYAPHFQKADELLREGVLGELRHIELHTLRTEPAADAGLKSWRTDPSLSGGGILVDHGWHSFYLILSMVRQKPIGLTAYPGNRQGPRGVEEEATCLVSFPKTTALIHLTWKAAKRSNFGVLYGTEATLEIHDDELALLRRGASSKTFRFKEKLSQHSAHPGWFQALLPDFKTETLLLKRENLQEAGSCVSLLVSALHLEPGGTAKIAPRAEIWGNLYVDPRTLLEHEPGRTRTARPLPWLETWLQGEWLQRMRWLTLPRLVVAAAAVLGGLFLLMQAFEFHEPSPPLVLRPESPAESYPAWEPTSPSALPAPRSAQEAIAFVKDYSLPGKGPLGRWLEKNLGSRPGAALSWTAGAIGEGAYMVECKAGDKTYLFEVQFSLLGHSLAPRNPAARELLSASFEVPGPTKPKVSDRRAADRAYQAGLICYEKGDLECAKREWERAKTLDPSHPNVKPALERLESNLGP